YAALAATLRPAAWLLVGLGLTVALASWLGGRYAHLLRRRRTPARATADPAPTRPSRARL
ncbi:hypothetical protein N6Q81_18110, partial [Streptomyces vinaceusdrappus]